MRQVFRIGILMSGLLVVMAGCSSMGWFRDPPGKFQNLPGKEETASDQHREGGEVSPTATATPLPADGKVRGPVQTLHVEFGVGRWDLDNTAQTTLLVLTKKLRVNPNLTVELEGYADSVGSHAYNLRLSQKRVEVVRRYLVVRGVEPARIQAAGVGQLPDGGTPDERAKNRRVTVKLMATKK